MGCVPTGNVPPMVYRRSTKTVRSSPSRSSRWPPLIWLTWALAWSATLWKMFMTIRYFLSKAKLRNVPVGDKQTKQITSRTLKSFFFFHFTKAFSLMWFTLMQSQDWYWLPVSDWTDSMLICALDLRAAIVHNLFRELNCFILVFTVFVSGLPSFSG